MSKEIPLASPTPSQDKADNEGEPPANPPARNSLVDKLFTAKDVDVSYNILKDNPDVPEPTPEEARRIRNKALAAMLPFYAITYHLMYVDKQNISSASILGLLPAMRMSRGQYNTAVTAFYIAYLVFELPQNYALQRFPIGRWLGANLIVWTGVLFAHNGISSAGALFGLRFLLGALEACAVPAVLISENQFFTHNEQAVIHTLVWAVGNSTPITAGLLSYASLFVDIHGWPKYKIFFIIIGAITGAFGIIVFFFYPNSPADAWFLNKRERVQAVHRTKGNREGIENKTWKKAQFIETLKDWKTWAFTLHAFCQELGNGLTSQYSLIIKSFGYSTLATTLLGCITGLTALVSLSIAAISLAYIKNFRAYISAIMYIPVILSGALALGLPWSAKRGLLAGIYLRSTTGVPYAVVMSWAVTCSAGHTKKQTTIALYHAAYGLSNSIAPQLYIESQAPRFIPAWTVNMVLAGIVPMFIVLITRYLLDKENKGRDGLDLSAEKLILRDEGHDGTAVHEKQADVNRLDLTDRQNLRFRYVL